MRSILDVTAAATIRMGELCVQMQNETIRSHREIEIENECAKWCIEYKCYQFSRCVENRIASDTPSIESHEANFDQFTCDRLKCHVRVERPRRFDGACVCAIASALARSTRNRVDLATSTLFIFVPKSLRARRF